MSRPARNPVVAGLVAAEERLRSAGLTGVKALDVLVDGLTRRLRGERVEGLAGEVSALVPVAAGGDLLGLAYERFLPDVFKGARGQFFTPPPLVRLVLARLDLRPGEVVLDPTCGTGGFLVPAARVGAEVRGIERDPHLVGLARINLALARIEGTVTHADFFSLDPDPVDVVVANPPFSVPITAPEALARWAAPARIPSDHLFVTALAAWVRPGGRAGVVLPWSIVANPSAADVREALAEAFAIRGICALPEGVFRPFGGAAGRAALLWLARHPAPARPTRWARLTDPGYDVRSRTLKPTSEEEVARLAAGQGWSDLPAGSWTPGGAPWRVPTRPLEAVATFVREPVPVGRVAGRVGVIDLADADPRTGEIPAPRVVEGGALRSGRVAVAPGQVLVARLRPERGNVAVAPELPEGVARLVGSPEWLVLETARPHFLALALRTIAWRRRLPVRTGQTRPRVEARAVAAMQVPWPGDGLVARIDAVAAELVAVRAALRADLVRLQEILDAYADGRVGVEAVERVVETIEETRGRAPGGRDG